MIKIGYGSENVIVHLTKQEFKFLADASYSDVPDGTDVSLISIKNKIDLLDSKEAELLDLKNLASSVVQKLTQIGI